MIDEQHFRTVSRLLVGLLLIILVMALTGICTSNWVKYAHSRNANKVTVHSRFGFFKSCKGQVDGDEICMKSIDMEEPLGGLYDQHTIILIVISAAGYLPSIAASIVTAKVPPHRLLTAACGLTIFITGLITVIALLMFRDKVNVSAAEMEFWWSYTVTWIASILTLLLGTTYFFLAAFHRSEIIPSPYSKKHTDVPLNEQYQGQMMSFKNAAIDRYDTASTLNAATRSRAISSRDSDTMISSRSIVLADSVRKLSKMEKVDIVVNTPPPGRPPMRRLSNGDDKVGISRTVALPPGQVNKLDTWHKKHGVLVNTATPEPRGSPGANSKHQTSDNEDHYVILGKYVRTLSDTSGQDVFVIRSSVKLTNEVSIDKNNKIKGIRVNDMDMYDTSL